MLLFGSPLFEGLELVLLIAAVAMAAIGPRRFVSIRSPERAPTADPPAIELPVGVRPVRAGGAESGGLPDRTAWADRVRAEASRCGRYDRSGAVVVFRLEAFDGILAASSELDRGRLCQAVTASLRRSARGFDEVFGDEAGAFRVLLVEADERGARSYVDRVADGALRPWMETITSDVSLTAAWASTSELTDLPAADRLADSRLAGVDDGWIRSAFVLRA